MDLPPVMTGLLKYGVASAIAVYLVYTLTTGIGHDVRVSTELLQRHVDATASLQRTIEADERWHATMVDVMRQLCVNSAKTYQERAACFQAGIR
jgi:hypothetical protein